MLFAIQNTPDTFQRTMNVILSSVKWQYALVHIYNIVIFIKTPEQYIDYLRKILLLLHSAGATFKLKKCNFSPIQLITMAKSFVLDV